MYKFKMHEAIEYANKIGKILREILQMKLHLSSFPSISYPFLGSGSIGFYIGRHFIQRKHT